MRGNGIYKHFLYYVAALLIAGVTGYLSLIILALIPFIGIILFFLFKEGAGSFSYLVFFAMLSIPSFIAFGRVMRSGGFPLNFGYIVICWLAGFGTLLILFPYIALPEVTPIQGIIVFVSIALTFGFALVRFLYINGVGDRYSPDNTFKPAQGWEEY